MRTVYFDVDTQLDFLFPAGALYVPGAEAIVPRLAELNRRAAADGMLVSTMDAHEEDDPEFRIYPPHCVQGTLGQRKPESTLVPGQIFLPKQTLDCFASPDLAPLLERLAADRYVVYGVVTEICVRHAALGLLREGKPVEIVLDATRHLWPARRDAFLDEFTRAGGTLA